METKGKQITFRIFLSAVFALLVTYIGIWVYNVFDRSGSFVNNESNDPAFTCVGYIYDISNTQYDDGTLSFNVWNKKYSDYPIDDLSVLTDTGDFKQFKVKRISRGQTKSIELDINLNKTFKVYPGKCELYGELVEVGANG